VAYHKSPVGQAFHQFFGENTLRSDLSVSVPELGSLLDHTGRWPKPKPARRATSAPITPFS
jgi:arginine/lysine/ornithine decarboxylase